MRLGDLDALKEELIKNEWITDTEGGGLEDIINDFPSATIDINDIEYKAYCKGIEDGRKIAARPTGEWENITPSNHLTPAEVLYCVAHLAKTVKVYILAVLKVIIGYFALSAVQK